MGVNGMATALVAAWLATALATDVASALTLAPAADTTAVLTLAPIEVRETRRSSDAELRLRPGFARSYDVSRSYGRLRMVSDLLAGEVGVHVRQFGGTGSFGAISIRGSAANQVAFYLDGVPLNSAQYGVVNAADLPIEALSRVEVYRGAAPLGLDSPGGGVVQLVSRQTPGGWSRLSAGGGSFGTEKADFAAGWRGAGHAALVVAQALRSEGNYRFLDDNGTPYNFADDGIARRQNNRSESLGLTARAEQQAGPIRMGVTHDRIDKRHGVPGIGANPALHSSFRADRDITNLLLGWRRRDDPSPPDRFLRLYAVEQRDRFSDPQGELTGLKQEGDDRTTKLGGQLQGLLRLPLHATVLADLDGRNERYAPRLVLPSPRGLPQSHRRTWAGGVEARETQWSGLLDLTASARRQTIDDDFGGGPPYPGALPEPASARTTNQNAWSVGLRLGPPVLGLKASIARLARVPTLEEMFGNRGGIYGNPKARPERILTRDLGLVSFRAWPAAARSVRPSWTEAQLSAYRSDAEDLLIFVQNSQRSSVAQNVSAARLEGFELSVRAGWREGWLGELSWTRQWTRDEGEAVYWRGMDLPGRPRDEGLARLSLARRSWNASYEFHYVAANPLDRANTSWTRARRLHDVALAVTPWAWSPEWTAECRNVGDERVEDFAGYPLPGRMFYVGARARLERKDHADVASP